MYINVAAESNCKYAFGGLNIILSKYSYTYGPFMHDLLKAKRELGKETLKCD